MPEEQRRTEEKEKRSGVADRTRTGDNWNHNPGLYQLSYSHHWNRRDQRRNG